MVVAFTKVALEHGWLGNMAPFPVNHAGIVWRTTEALFQALRFDDEAVREEIRAARSPMAAKMIAKRESAKMVVVPRSPQDLSNMEMILRLKLDQHPELKEQLLATGDEAIIEDCTKRPSGSFWGAAWNHHSQCWDGENTLGFLWMKLRKELQGEK